MEMYTISVEPIRRLNSRADSRTAIKRSRLALMYCRAYKSNTLARYNPQMLHVMIAK